MVQGSSVEWLSQLLSVPVLAASIVIGLALLVILIWLWKTLSMAYKTMLIVPCLAAFTLAFVLIGLAIAFGSNHPPTDPRPAIL